MSLGKTDIGSGIGYLGYHQRHFQSTYKICGSSNTLELFEGVRRV